jgi:hypothetical protein
MSYNIDTWKTAKLDNLVIPIHVFYEHERKDWHPTMYIINHETMQIELECGCDQLIKGKLKDGMLTVTEFKMSGEGSGTFKDLILDEALKRSKGELEAILIWEGGDSITRLKVKDGILEESDVDFEIPTSKETKTVDSPKYCLIHTVTVSG